MPSPRAVLADIHNLSLDPAKAWSSLDKSGRLKAPHKPEIHVSNMADVEKKLDVEELVETTPEFVDEPVEQSQVDELEELFAIDNSEASDSTPTEFSDNLDSGSELDSFRPKKKKK